MLFNSILHSSHVVHTEWSTEKCINRSRQMWQYVITGCYCCGYVMGRGLAGCLPPHGQAGGNPLCINGFLIVAISVFKCAGSYFLFLFCKSIWCLFWVKFEIQVIQDALHWKVERMQVYKHFIKMNQKPWHTHIYTKAQTQHMATKSYLLCILQLNSNFHSLQ
jgi:hypothetical protein